MNSLGPFMVKMGHMLPFPGSPVNWPVFLLTQRIWHSAKYRLQWRGAGRCQYATVQSKTSGIVPDALKPAMRRSNLQLEQIPM